MSHMSRVLNFRSHTGTKFFLQFLQFTLLQRVNNTKDTVTRIYRPLNGRCFSALSLNSRYSLCLTGRGWEA